MESVLGVLILTIILRIISTIQTRKFNKKKELKKREFEQAENQELILESYSIQNERFHFWTMIICFVAFSFTLVLGVYSGLNQLDVIDVIDAFIIIFFVSLAFITLMLVLYHGLWKITVKGEKIFFRNSFGVIKRYQFDDITCVVKTIWELRVYSGNKLLFNILEDVDYVYFDIQLSLKGVPKKSRKEFKRIRTLRDKP